MSTTPTIHGIMGIEDARRKLQKEREAYVRAHLADSTSKTLKRRVQNRINKYTSRWKTSFYLETAEDYRVLACEIQDMREGRAKEREGRPRRTNERCQRPARKRLTEKRQKSEDVVNLEQEGVFHSVVVNDFDQLDNILPFEDAIPATDVTTSYSSITSGIDDFVLSISSEIDRTPNRTPDSFPSNFSKLYNSQTLSQYSNLPSLADATCYNSNEMIDPASMSALIYSEIIRAGDTWVEPLQNDICDGNSTNLKWQSDLATFSFSHPEWNPLVATTNRLKATQKEKLDLHHAIPSMSGDVNSYTQTQSPEVLTQQKKVKHETQMIVNPKCQLEKKKDAIPKQPVISTQPSLEHEALASLIEQCLRTLGGSTPHIFKDETPKSILRDRRTVQKYETEVRLQMTVENI
ncbi:hypothetical protein ACMFMF_011884 [Clarireedia jacksonii]